MLSNNNEESLMLIEDEKHYSTAVFVLKSHDHTVGNLVVSMLQINPHIIFAGYRVRHPMKNDILLRIQTDGGETVDSNNKKIKVWTPIEAFKKAVDDLSEALESLHSFIEEKNEN